MLALEVEYLTGRAQTKRVGRTDRAEWPPHPFRLFSALVAAHYETGVGPGEREALLWLEAQGAPALVASGASERAAPTAFVPVNDSEVPVRPPKDFKAEHLAVLPERRGRQARTFPSVTPDEPRAVFVWPEATPDPATREVLGALAAKVGYLGHSSSLVSVSVRDESPAPTHVPDAEGDLVLRVTMRGQLQALDEAHERRKATGARGALPCLHQRYRRVGTGGPSEGAARRGLFGDVVVFRLRDGPPLPSTALVELTRAFRGAALTHADQPPAEVLTGHASPGRPTTRPHVAWLALPHVDHRYATGLVIGVAAALPRSLTADELRAVLKALGRIERLTLGPAGAWGLERASAAERAVALDPLTWRGPSRRWATATPVLLDRYPKELDSDEARAVVAAACANMGLPRPLSIGIDRVSRLRGAAPSRDFLQPTRPDRPRRAAAHLELEFAELVEGPVLLGAGRFFGLGLLRPLRGAEARS